MSVERIYVKFELQKKINMALELNDSIFVKSAIISLKFIESFNSFKAGLSLISIISSTVAPYIFPKIQEQDLNILQDIGDGIDSTMHKISK